MALVAIALVPASAQDQKTLGPCSPAIARVQGNVSVTCLTGNRRIRIAKYEGEIDEDKGVDFGSFLEANLSHIVHVRVGASGMSKPRLYAAERDFAYFHLERKSHAAHCFRLDKLDEKDERDCGSMQVSFTDEKNAVQTAHWIHGAWVYEGYYLVSFTGFFQGVETVLMRQIDDKDVLLSDKYETQ
jgi:hypothetical protein